MSANNQLKEQITALLQSGADFKEIADALSLTEKEIEHTCFLLCKQNPNQFDINDYLTKEWLEEKIISHSIIEIANITGMRYRQIQYLLTKYGLSVRESNNAFLPKEEQLRQLYVEEKMTDRQIADQFGTSISTIKNLRYKYGIMKTDRISIDQIMTKELFHRLYVQLNISMIQIAQLFDVSRPTIVQFKEQYSVGEDKISKEISVHRALRRHQELFERMLSKIRHADLIQKLKDKSILEVAAEYKLIIHTDHKLVPFSREWFLYELQTKSPTRISLETKQPYHEISKMIDDYGIDRSQRIEEIDPQILRHLFLDLYWSDSEIADQFNVPPTAITQQRRNEEIFAENRLPLEERLPLEFFSKLYLTERMSLFQISRIFRTSLVNVRALKNKYIDEGHSEFDNLRIPGVSPERFEYLNKQITLGLLKA